MSSKSIATLIDRRRFIELTAIGGGVLVISSLPGCGSRERDGGSPRGGADRGFTQDGLSRMRETLAGYVGNDKVPGLVALVSRRGQTHVEALGVKTLGEPAPMTRDTIFRIASMTKPVTAVATLILVEEGKLRLDETVERLLPELANRRVLVATEKLNRVPTSYMANPQTGALAVYDKPQGQWSGPPAFPSGAGGLVSTVDDFLLFARMLLDKGKHDAGRILSEQSVAQMTSDHLTPEQKAVSGFFPGFFDNRGWGFGVSMITKPDSVTSVPGRYGWDGGLGTTWFNDPGQDLVAVLMTQRALGDAAWSGPAFEKAVYAAIES